MKKLTTSSIKNPFYIKALESFVDNPDYTQRPGVFGQVMNFVLFFSVTASMIITPGVVILILNSMYNLGKYEKPLSVAFEISPLFILITIILIVRPLREKFIKMFKNFKIRHFYKGLLIGFLFSLLNVVTCAWGNLNGLQLNNTNIALIFVTFISVILGAFAEEFILRFFAISILFKGYSPYVQILLSAGIFAAIHLIFSPNHLLIGCVAFSFGIAMGTVYIKTKSIAMPFAIHLCWNMVEKVLLSPENENTATIFTYKPAGNLIFAPIQGQSAEGCIIGMLISLGLLIFVIRSEKIYA